MEIHESAYIADGFHRGRKQYLVSCHGERGPGEDTYWETEQYPGQYGGTCRQTLSGLYRG